MRLVRPSGTSASCRSAHASTNQSRLQIAGTHYSSSLSSESSSSLLLSRFSMLCIAPPSSSLSSPLNWLMVCCIWRIRFSCSVLLIGLCFLVLVGAGTGTSSCGSSSSGALGTYFFTISRTLARVSLGTTSMSSSASSLWHDCQYVCSFR